MTTKKVKIITPQRWREFRKFEGRLKQQFLKKLTFKESFNILNDLYQFTYPFIERDKFNLPKLRLLRRRRAIFNKVNPQGHNL